MARIAATAEEALVHAAAGTTEVSRRSDVQEAVSAAVCDLASDLCACGHRPGHRSPAPPRSPSHATVPMLRSWRPRLGPRSHGRLQLVWGVRPLVVEFAEDTDALLDSVLIAVREAGLAAPGEQVALTAGRAGRRLREGPTSSSSARSEVRCSDTFRHHAEHLFESLNLNLTSKRQRPLCCATIGAKAVVAAASSLACTQDSEV